MKTTNAVILGFGRWGQLLHRSSLSAEHINVTGVVTRTPGKVEQYCAEAGLILHPNLTTALSDKSVDAVVIATPHSQHFAQLMQVAEASKHVYCEKPFALNGDQARQALAALADHGCKVAIGHNRRFAPNTLALKKMIAEGWFGDLVHIDGVFHAFMAQSKGQWRDSVEESPAGGMTSLGIHVVDMFVNLMGPVTRLRSQSERISPSCAFDDNTSVSLEFANGGRGHLSTITSTAMRWRITLHGTNGWAELEDQDKLIVQPVEGERQVQHFPGYDYPAEATITAALDAFAVDIQGGASFPVTPREIEHSTRVLQGIIDSSETGKLIEV